MLRSFNLKPYLLNDMKSISNLIKKLNPILNLSIH